MSGVCDLSVNTLCLRTAPPTQGARVAAQYSKHELKYAQSKSPLWWSSGLFDALVLGCLFHHCVGGAQKEESLMVGDQWWGINPPTGQPKKN